jgi:DNA-binding NarL/FixJ family response regulator
MIRCLIADDHAIVQRGLKHLLEEHLDMEPPGEAGDATQVLERIRGDTWDVLILDVNMPGATGLDLLHRVHRERPDLPILILSAHPEDQFAVRMLQAGAAGYLSKQSAAEELVVAVRRVLQGRKYVSAELAEQLAAALDTKAPGRPQHEALSDREFQVLRRIGAGRTVSEIAEELHLSVKTVSTYRARILQKMGLRTNAELTLYAVKNQLVSDV